jgi:hypothetical protein
MVWLYWSLSRQELKGGPWVSKGSLMDKRRAGPLFPQQASQCSRCGLRFIASRGLEAQVTSNHPMFLPPSSLDYWTEPLVPAENFKYVSSSYWRHSPIFLIDTRFSFQCPFKNGYRITVCNWFSCFLNQYFLLRLCWTLPYKQDGTCVVEFWFDSNQRGWCLPRNQSRQPHSPAIDLYEVRLACSRSTPLVHYPTPFQPTVCQPCPLFSDRRPEDKLWGGGGLRNF